MKINSVELDKIYDAEKEIYNDLNLANKKIAIDGRWNFNDDAGQFTTVLKSSKNIIELKSDNPDYLGGSENYPEPMKYFLFGIACSFASSYVNSASIKGILLKELHVKIEGKLNYSYFYSISDDPRIEEIKLTLTVDSVVTKRELLKLKDSAIKCCPALFAIDKDVKVDIQLISKRSVSVNNSIAFLNLN